MKFIAHRGNWCGKKEEYENSPDYINEAIAQGFDVEIDIWKKDGDLYLGHDAPEISINEKYIFSISKYAWIHAKNLDVAEWLHNTKTNWFWHQNDHVTFTSRNILWTYPEIFLQNSVINQPNDNSIFWNNQLWKQNSYVGICHDNPLKCKRLVKI